MFRYPHYNEPFLKQVRHSSLLPFHWKYEPRYNELFVWIGVPKWFVITELWLYITFKPLRFYVICVRFDTQISGFEHGVEIWITSIHPGVDGVDWWRRRWTRARADCLGQFDVFNFGFRQLKCLFLAWLKPLKAAHFTQININHTLAWSSSSIRCFSSLYLSASALASLLSSRPFLSTSNESSMSSRAEQTHTSNVEPD